MLNYWTDKQSAGRDPSPRHDGHKFRPPTGRAASESGAAAKNVYKLTAISIQLQCHKIGVDLRPNLKSLSHAYSAGPTHAVIIALYT